MKLILEDNIYNNHEICIDSNCVNLNCYNHALSNVNSNLYMTSCIEHK